MLKQAAHVLRDQKKIIDDLRQKIATSEKAVSIVQKMVEDGDIAAEEGFTKVSELRTKSLEELEMMEKAAHYFNNSHVGLGKLSDQTETSSNPLLDFLFNEA